ncbi:MAG: gamma-glutamyl-gamma-aminobutyrate hydrolase family protein [Pyrinomonadaceae bacterium]
MRPRIGITMRLEMETHRFYLGRDYSEVVEDCGGIPVHFALIPKAEYIAEAMAGVDGILLPGSNTDIDPHFYGEEPHHRLGTVIPAKDETDRLVLAEAERLNLPLLAICYGMQALNVIRGGSLIQDIESQVKESHKHEQGPPATRNSHTIDIEKASILGGLDAVIGSDKAILVNSSHHQALNRVGKDLKATAWARDGVIEAIEDTREGRFNLGVQWHPELTSSHDRLSREIFDLFIATAGAKAKTNASAMCSS